ncbi:MAG: DNA-methyltransferase [Acidimicrobiales bacterium]
MSAPSIAVRHGWERVDEQVRSRVDSGQLVAADPAAGSWLLRGDVFDMLDQLGTVLEGKVAMIFADPPYFIGKAAWDRRTGIEEQLAFSEEWLAGCRDLLTEYGSLWACGGFTSMPIVGYAIQRLGLKLLSHVTWQKPNPPPNRGCRGFVHATESLFWAAKRHGARYRFNYQCMRRTNGGKQMHSHWRLATAPMAEKHCGRHPTQKPLALVERCLEATTRRGDLVLDPFVGSGTTAVAARRLGRGCIGIDQHRPYLEIARRRLGQAVPTSSSGTAQ